MIIIYILFWSSYFIITMAASIVVSKFVSDQLKTFTTRIKEPVIEDKKEL